MYLLKDPFQANERRWFITPTYRQGKMIVFPILRQMFQGFTGAKLNESEMSVVFNNGAELAVKGADNEHNLRGVELTKCVMDEMAYIKPHVWEEIVYPMLATTQGSVLFIGTPNGYDTMYDLYSRGQSEPNWKLMGALYQQRKSLMLRGLWILHCLDRSLRPLSNQLGIELLGILIGVFTLRKQRSYLLIFGGAAISM